jgi:Helix-turn-helix domain
MARTGVWCVGAHSSRGLRMYGHDVEVIMPPNILSAMATFCFEGHAKGSQIIEVIVVKEPKGEKKERDWLTVPEACDIAGVSSNTIKNWAVAYGIGIKVGGRYRISPEGLDKVLRGEATKFQPE